MSDVAGPEPEAGAGEARRRLRAEASLRESEAMRDVAERVSRMGSFRRDLDPTSPRATWSRGMYAVLDMDAADFDGDPLPVLEARVHPDDRARVRQAGEDVAAGGAPAPVEFRIVHRDGSEHILYSESALECDEAGTPVAIAGYYRDVTEQRRAEEANARLAAIVESSEDAVFSKTIEGTILTWNAGAERMYGYAADEIIGESVALLIPPGSEGELIELLDHIRSGTPIERHEAVRLRKDGSELDVSLSMSPIRDAAGRVVGASAIAHDVTERRRAEQKILRLDRLYVTLAAVNRVIVRAQTRGSLFEDICRVAVEEGGFRMAWIGLIDEADQQVRPATSAGHEDGYLTDFEIAYLDEELGRGPTGTAIREGRCVICQDIPGDPRMAPWRASALDHGYRSSASVPIRQSGAVIGALTVYSDESAAFGVDDEGLLDGAGHDISYALDSLQALEAVRQSEAMRDSAEHAARTGSFRWCLGSPGSAWSPEVRELFDVAPGEFDEDIVRAIGARVHPDDLEALGRRVADVAANGALATVEFRVRRRDGSERVIMAGGTGERDAEGTVVALVGYVQDVTEQRRVEMELRESEAMRDLAESVAHVGSLRWDLASQRVALTPEGCRLFGVSPEDFDGDIATILGGSVHPDDLGIAERALVASAETGISDPVEFRLLLPDDTVRFVHGEGKAERDASGAPIAIVGYFQDVTEQRLAKQELELAYDRLDIAQQAAGAGTFEFHAETRGFSFSPQLYGLFGLDPESDPGSFDTLRRVVHPDDIEATWETYASALRDRTQLQAEYRIIRASDGEVRWVDSLGHGVYDDAGRPLSLIGLCVDVTERKRGEQALRENAERHSAILHTAMDGYVLVDTEGHLLEVNEAYCRMSGYSAEELQHMHLSDLESAEAPDETQAHIEKIIASGADRFETRHRRKDGSVYDVETSVQYRSSEHGQFVAFLRDVTERKRSERLLGVPSEILSIMSTAMAAPETAARIVRTLKEATGFDAVGIRLRDGDDYPFVAAMGYPDDFLKAENSLTTNQPGVGLCRTADGAVALDCTCGLVISGATDPSNPLFTPGGSAWTSDASRAPEGPAVEDQRLRPRDRCVHVGFRSIALVPLRAGDQILGLMHLADNGPGHFTPEAIGFFEGLGASIGVALLRERAEEELTRSAHELREQLFDTVKAMGAIVGVRDPYTAAHELRVTGLALAVAEEMGLDEERREGLALAGEVHDIGKVAVPAEILSKPAALNEIEFTLVRQHSETGREILSAINFRQPVAAIVAQHHERLDGSGYPDGLKGDEIMLESRILAVADVVEAMSSHRPYRPGLGLEAALAEARSGAGTRYDGDVVAACERVFAQGFVFPEA